MHRGGMLRCKPIFVLIVMEERKVMICCYELGCPVVSMGHGVAMEICGWGGW